MSYQELLAIHTYTIKWYKHLSKVQREGHRGKMILALMYYTRKQLLIMEKSIATRFS